MIVKVINVITGISNINEDIKEDGDIDTTNGSFEFIKTCLSDKTGIDQTNYLFPTSIAVGLSLFLTIMIDSTTETTTTDHVSKVRTTSKKWLYNNKSLKMFIVVLICMTISLFLSLSVEYNVFYHLYRILKNLMEFNVVYIVPLGSIIVSIVHFVFSLKNHDKFKNRIHVKKND